MDAQFADLQFQEQQFPQLPRDPKRLYKNYVKRTYESAVNIICASCGCCYYYTSDGAEIPLTTDEVPPNLLLSVDFKRSRSEIFYL